MKLTYKLSISMDMIVEI